VSAPWPCSQCGAPGFRNVYTRGYCVTHLAELYACFDRQVWDGQGVGVQAGVHRTDHGPAFYDLQCTLCGATWVGPLLDPCSWCAERAARDLSDIRHELLYPEWAVPQGERYEALSELDKRVWDQTRGIRRGVAVEHAWARALRQAIEAGIITVAEADDAINRLERSA
jgi:hypothetical protein